MASIRLKDLDGTVKGLAVLVGIPLDDPDGKVYQDRFLEGDWPDRDPITAAERLRAATQDDFPGYEFVIASNERAKYLAWVTKMQWMLGDKTDVSVSQYRSLTGR